MTVPARCSRAGFADTSRRGSIVGGATRSRPSQLDQLEQPRASAVHGASNSPRVAVGSLRRSRTTTPRRSRNGSPTADAGPEPVQRDGDAVPQTLRRCSHVVSQPEAEGMKPLAEVLPNLTQEERQSCVTQLAVGLALLHGRGSLHGRVSCEAVRTAPDATCGRIFCWVAPDSTAPAGPEGQKAEAEALAELALRVLGGDAAGNAETGPGAAAQAQQQPSLLGGRSLDAALGASGAWEVLEPQADARVSAHAALTTLAAAATGATADLGPCATAAAGEAEAAERLARSAQRDAFLAPARAGLELRARTAPSAPGAARGPGLRAQVAALLSVGRSWASVEAEAEAASIFLQAGWIAEAWGCAACASSKLDAWEADWANLKDRIGAAAPQAAAGGKEEAVEGGAGAGAAALARLLPATALGCEQAHNRPRRLLEKVRSAALEQLSDFPAWPLLLPLGAAREAVHSAAQQQRSEQPQVPTALLNLAETLPAQCAVGDVLTPLFCSEGPGPGPLGVHLVQPCGVLFWVEDTAQPVSPTPTLFSEVGSVATGAVAAQRRRRMVFVQHCPAGWETYVLRSSAPIQGGVQHTLLLQGPPAVLLLLHSGNTLERFELPPPHRSLASRPTQGEHRMTVAFATPGVSEVNSTPSQRRDKPVVSTSVTIEALLSSLGFEQVEGGQPPQAFGLFQADDREDGKLLIPLCPGPTELRVLVSTLGAPPQALRTLTLDISRNGGGEESPEFRSPSMSPAPPLSMPVSPTSSLRVEAKATTPRAGSRARGVVAALSPRKANSGLERGVSTASSMGGRESMAGLHFSLPLIAAKLRRNLRRASELNQTRRPEGQEASQPLTCFFMPQIWEVVGCREDQLVWWHLPSPLSAAPEPEAAAGQDAAAPPEGPSPTPAGEVQAHVRRDLPFTASCWRRLPGAGMRLAAFASGVGGADAKKGKDDWPHYVAVVEAWHGNILALLQLPSWPSSWPSSPPPDDSLVPPSTPSRGWRLAASNGIIAVSANGHSAFWSVASLCDRSGERDSQAQAGPQLTAREQAAALSAAVKTEPPAPVRQRSLKAVDQRASNGMVDLPEALALPPLAALDVPLVDCPECLCLQGALLCSTGSSLRAVFLDQAADKDSEEAPAPPPAEPLAGLARWAASLPALPAPALARAWATVRSALSELRTRLQGPKASWEAHLPFLASVLEVCDRTAEPLRFALHGELQELRMRLARCAKGLQASPQPRPASVDRGGGGSSPSPGPVAPSPGPVPSLLCPAPGLEGGRAGSSCADIEAVTLSSPLWQSSAEMLADLSAASCRVDPHTGCMVASYNTDSQIGAVALDACGRQLLLVLGKPTEQQPTRWMVEFWRRQPGGEWRCTGTAEAAAAAEQSPCCALSDRGVIGLTAASCICGWDCDDAELILQLAWSEEAPAIGLWCSGDAGRIAAATNEALHLWHERELVQSMDWRAVLALTEQCQTRGNQRSRRRLAGYPKMTKLQKISSARCDLAPDGMSVLGAIVDNRWLAVLAVGPPNEESPGGRTRVAYVQTPPDTEASAFAFRPVPQQLQSLWASASGTLLLLVAGRLEVWSVPMQMKEVREVRGLHRSATPAGGIAAEELPPQAKMTLHQIPDVFQKDVRVEEAFRRLGSQRPEEVLDLRNRTCVSLALPPTRRLLAFSERSRLLLCWDAAAPAILGVSLPDQAKSPGGQLFPTWVMPIPVNTPPVSLSLSAEGDVAAVGVGDRWCLWSFHDASTWKALAAPAAEEKRQPPATPRFQALLNAMTFARKACSVSGSKPPLATPQRASRAEREEEAATAQAARSAALLPSPPPPLPASSGTCLRPARWWEAAFRGTGSSPERDGSADARLTGELEHGEELLYSARRPLPPMGGTRRERSAPTPPAQPLTAAPEDLWLEAVPAIQVRQPALARKLSTSVPAKSDVSRLRGIFSAAAANVLQRLQEGGDGLPDSSRRSSFASPAQSPLSRKASAAVELPKADSGAGTAKPSPESSTCSLLPLAPSLQRAPSGITSQRLAQELMRVEVPPGWPCAPPTALQTPRHRLGPLGTPMRFWPREPVERGLNTLQRPSPTSGLQQQGQA